MQHLRLYFFAGFAVLVIASTVLFALFRTTPQSGTSTWEAASGFLPWGESTTLGKQEKQVYSGTGVDIAGGLPAPSMPLPDAAAEGTFDELAELLANLVKPQGSATASSGDFTPSAYSFIPRGLLSVNTSQPRSAEQEALHEYGDRLGLSLATFANLHPDMPQTLKDQAEDRTNTSKGNTMKKLGDDFIATGAEIANMDSIPPAAKTLHEQLAAAYKEVCENMKKIPDARGDEAFLAAINTYNASSDTLSIRLVGLVDLFQSRTVTFSSSDPGNIFTFNANSSF